MKSSFRAWGSLLAALASISSSFAIELFRPVRLSESPYGSGAVGAFRTTVEGDAVHYILGFTNDAGGSPMPAITEVHSDGEPYAALLPVPQGWCGEAVGGAALANGDLLVVGNIEICGQEQTHGVVWRKPFMGPWSPPMPLFPNAPTSRMARADYCGDGMPHALAVGSVGGSAGYPTGGVPAAVEIDESGHVVAYHFLLIPPGAEGSALAARCAFPMCGGWFRQPGGLRQPAIWLPQGSSFQLQTLAIPSGASGVVRDLALLDSGWAACGSLTRNGRTRGFFGSDSGISDLMPLPGYDDCTGESMVAAGGGVGALNHAWGTYHFVSGPSMNPGERPAATIWVLNENNVQRASGREILVDDTTWGVMSFGTSGGNVNDGLSFFGNCTDDNSPPGGFACAFLPTSTQVPDGFELPVGRWWYDEDLQYAENDIVARTWHEDGRAARMRSQRVGGVQTVELVARYDPVCGVDGVTYGNLQIVTRARSMNPAAAQDLEILVEDPSDGSWHVVAVCEDMYDDIYGLYDVPLPGNASTWVDPGSGAVRIMLRVTSTHGGPFGFEIDSLRLRLD